MPALSWLLELYWPCCSVAEDGRCFAPLPGWLFAVLSTSPVQQSVPSGDVLSLRPPFCGLPQHGQGPLICIHGAKIWDILFWKARIINSPNHLNSIDIRRSFSRTDRADTKRELILRNLDAIPHAGGQTDHGVVIGMCPLALTAISAIIISKLGFHCFEKQLQQSSVGKMIIT